MNELRNLLDETAMRQYNCAWCPGFTPDSSGTESHGICPSCEKQMISKLNDLEVSDDGPTYYDYYNQFSR